MTFHERITALKGPRSSEFRSALSALSVSLWCAFGIGFGFTRAWDGISAAKIGMLAMGPSLAFIGALAVCLVFWSLWTDATGPWPWALTLPSLFMGVFAVIVQMVKTSGWQLVSPEGVPRLDLLWQNPVVMLCCWVASVACSAWALRRPVRVADESSTTANNAG